MPPPHVFNTTVIGDSVVFAALKVSVQ